jgi:hypothetical protein
MYEVGRIKLVQVQLSTLKVGERPYRYYDPAPLMVVESLTMTRQGCVGIVKSGEKIMDKHHSKHPQNNNEGNNGVSFSFVGHYETMRKRFGEHVWDGCAGENILIESEGFYELGDLGQRLVIENASTGEKAVLRKLLAAVPCLQFSAYVLDKGRSAYNAELAAKDIKETLQFLQHGMRGFYATLEGGEVEIRAGDRVLVDEKLQIF